jgi:ferrous-iron efflux pump FieF
LSIARQAFDILVDRELPDEILERVHKISCSHPKVLGIHELRTRSSGLKYFIQLHIDVHDDLSLMEAHQISDDVEKEILLEFPNADILIHQDPVSLKSL